MNPAMDSSVKIRPTGHPPPPAAGLFGQKQSTDGCRTEALIRSPDAAAGPHRQALPGRSTPPR